MGKSRRPTLLAATSLIALLLLGCGQNGSQAGSSDLPLSLADVRDQLATDDAFQREAPFTSREFKPYLGGEWIGNAVSYGPFRAGQAPGQVGPSEAEILEDLSIITQHWNLVRVYGADDDTERVLSVIEKHALPVKVMVGIWVEPEEDNPERKAANVEQVLRGIELANRYSEIVLAVNVGNETQVFWSGHRMNPDNLIQYIRVVRASVAVPVTTADDYNFWNKPESKVVAEEVDFIVTHIYPLWNGKTLDEAIDWMDKTYRQIQAAHPDRVIVLGETGWATDYNADKTGPGEQGTLVKGEVGLEAQAEYLVQHNEWVDANQVTCFLFEAFDEPWKGGGENTPPNEIEKHWGVFYEDRTPKPSFVEYLSRAVQSTR
jgi:exo-beta-1,3-glucanase (GH17 family)